jgi:hypothetical protein
MESVGRINDDLDSASRRKGIPGKPKGDPGRYSSWSDAGRASFADLESKERFPGKTKPVLY